MPVEPHAIMDRYGWSLTLVLPYPDTDTMNALNPHAGGNRHWKKSGATKAQRSLAESLVAPIAPESPWLRARATFRFFKPTDRTLDHQNMIQRLKGAIDGVVDAGLLKGDDDKHLETGSAHSAIDPEHPRLEIVFDRLRTDWGHRA